LRGTILINVDGARGLKRDIFEFVLGDLEIAVPVDLITFDEIVGRNLVAGVGIDLHIANVVAGILMI
jgi:hypothetical protein